MWQYFYCRGHIYYPKGGMADVVKIYWGDDEAVSEAARKEHSPLEEYDWHHLYRVNDDDSLSLIFEN